ncbi:MAG: rhodanese-like domain-containing protein [Clostridiales bacterium]|nr:rhodanese-like domain-containing protein [Clostridiales bacterium]
MWNVISAAEFHQYQKEGRPMVVIDMRNPEDYERGHVPDAVNLPGNSWMNYRDALPRDRLLVFYCYHGGNSMQAARQFSRIGYQAVSVYGGTMFLSRNGEDF